MTNHSLSYRCAIITGASSGIGEALVRQLAEYPMHLVLVARREEPLQSLAVELQRPPDSMTILPIDVVRPDSHEQVVSILQARGLQADLLVNNAGFGSYGFFHETPIDRQLDMIDLNVSALVRWTHRFLKPMVELNHGAIVNMSSVAGFQPVPFMSTYAATKAFVTSFSMGLASELCDTKIRVITVCPGRTRTNFQVVAGSRKVKIRSRFATADQVAAVTIRALHHEHTLVIEGTVNRMTVHLQRLFPRRTIVSLARKIFKPRS